MDKDNTAEAVAPTEEQGAAQAIAVGIPPDVSEQLHRSERELERIRRAGLEALFPDTGGNLLAHARRELDLAGLFKSDSDYNGMVAFDVVDLVRVFASQGHSGGSAQLTIELFTRLASFDVLTPITAHPAEWMEVGTGMFQNRRKSSVFWREGNQTWYDINEPIGPAKAVK